MDYMLNDRKFFNRDNYNFDLLKSFFGFFIYFVFFVITIPNYLIKNSKYEILAGYLPNLHLIASVISYNGGPFNLLIWKDLYNPMDTSLVPYISSNLINYFALLGVTYVIALYTFILNDIDKGWSRAFIMIPMAYFVPGNFIINYMNKFGNYLNKYIYDINNTHYFITIIYGMMLTMFFILLESEIIHLFGNTISKLIKNYRKL
tara:strand:- start:30 stop:641 length:612 start_codon:yes stop_codon:yes gene_type:complete